MAKADALAKLDSIATSIAELGDNLQMKAQTLPGDDVGRKLGRGADQLRRLRLVLTIIVGDVKDIPEREEGS